MTIQNLKDVVQSCYDGGQFNMFGFRKVPAVPSVVGLWSDLSMAPGNPKPNYYVGTELTSTLIDARAGLFHGESVSPREKFLHMFTFGGFGSAVQAGTYIICDLLLFYPLVDMDSPDEQALINTIALPRYADGVGVRAFLVATNPYIGGQAFTITYTDHTGTAGIQSRLQYSNTGANIGVLVNTGSSGTGCMGPFIPTAEPNGGVRSVQAVQFYGPNGGLASLVLCRPLATVYINELSAFSEFDFASTRPSLPRIYDGAVLSLLCVPAGTITAQPYTGVMTSIFN